MTQHLHSERVEGCYRCELRDDEVASALREERIEAAASALFAHRTAFDDGRVPCEWDYDFSGPFALGAQKQLAYNDASLALAAAEAVGGLHYQNQNGERE